MTRPTHCPGCGGQLVLFLSAKTITWRRTGFTALIPATCTSCATRVAVEQVYVDGDRLGWWSISAVGG